MKGVLEGVKVLELGNFISGPYGACLLADMGAEVIKVVNPKGGAAEEIKKAAQKNKKG